MTSVPPVESEQPSPTAEAAADGCAFYCPAFHETIEMVGRRWSGVIVLALAGGEATFSAIKALIPGISDRLLSDRLKELEGAGMVDRTPHGREVLYALTEQGSGLLPILDAVFAFNADWAIQPS